MGLFDLEVRPEDRTGDTPHALPSIEGKACPIVGIGASMGGFEAFVSFAFGH